MERLVGARTIADLKKRILPAGLRDVQDWTGITLTFMRRGADGWDDLLTTPLISIRLEGTQGVDSVQETSRRGTAKVFVEDIGTERLQQGDRFTWDGHVCVIDVAQPNRLETYIAIDFTLLEN